MFGRLPRGYTIYRAYTFGGCCPVTEFCQVQNSVCVLQVLRSPIGSVTARHSSSGREPNFAALSTGRHLYSAGRPSRWALAHILVLIIMRLHRHTTYVDAAYCYRPSSVVGLYVDRSVTLVSPTKTAEPIEIPFWLRTRVGPRNHVLDGSPDHPVERGNFRGNGFPL